MGSFWKFSSKTPQRGFTLVSFITVLCAMWIHSQLLCLVHSSGDILLGHFYPTLSFSQSDLNTERLESLEGPLFASETHGISSDLPAHVGCALWTQHPHIFRPHIVFKAHFSGRKGGANASHSKMLSTKEWVQWKLQTFEHLTGTYCGCLICSDTKGSLSFHKNGKEKWKRKL